MKFFCAFSLLLLFPALSLNSRQTYEGLERRLKDVFAERTGILRQLSKTSKELDGIKGNLQSLKNDDTVAKKDVQRVLELSQKQREEMKSLQAALQKQLDEATERAEKQQATINFLKTEMERKSKIIKDLQQEVSFQCAGKWFPPRCHGTCTEDTLTGADRHPGGGEGEGNVLFSSLERESLLIAVPSTGTEGEALHCEFLYLHAPTHRLLIFPLQSKKIQAQLKELRYGKKDLVFKGQQLMDLERKLLASKEELEKTALDKESQLKALKDTVHLCFSSVLQSHPPSSHALLTAPSHLTRFSALANSSRVTFQQPHAKNIPKMLRIVTSKAPSKAEPMKRDTAEVKDCQSEKVDKICSQNQTEKWSPVSKTAALNLNNQEKSHDQPKLGNDIMKLPEDGGEQKGGDQEEHN
nr:leucine zipper protein 2-like [Paramormyrops kingsleyae]